MSNFLQHFFNQNSKVLKRKRPFFPRITIKKMYEENLHNFRNDF